MTMRGYVVALFVNALLLTTLFEGNGFVTTSPSFRRSHLSMNREYRDSMDTFRSLASFHQGTWVGKATSFAITSDTASGIVNRHVLPEYKTTVKIGIDLIEKQDYLMSETMEWGDKVATRKLSLVDSTCDVDSVDSSYSQDTTLPDLPVDLTGTEKLIQFGIEHCIAYDSNERTRCFLLYDFKGSLARVVLCEEQRSEEDRQKRAAEAKVAEEEKVNGSATSEQPASDGIIDAVIVEKDGEAISSEQDDGTSEEPLRPCAMNLLQLGNGVWLGDVVTRTPKSYVASKGFKSAEQPDVAMKRFAQYEWGVQKMVHQFDWDLEDTIRKVVTPGKSMGRPMSEESSASLSGMVCVDETFMTTMPQAERMIFLDWNAGQFAGFIIDSYSILAPRYISFEKSGGGNRRPFCTEFCVFQGRGIRPWEEQVMAIDDEENDDSELTCSLISRVYDSTGGMKQGATGFFSLKSFAAIANEKSSKPAP